MNIKLQKKLERQARMTERLMGNYSLGCKKAKGTKYSNRGLWSHQNDKSNNVPGSEKIIVQRLHNGESRFV